MLSLYEQNTTKMIYHRKMTKLKRIVPFSGPFATE